MYIYYTGIYRANGILIWWDYGNADGTATVNVILQPTRVGARDHSVYFDRIIKQNGGQKKQS